jgi:hypothetical protein
MDLSFPITVTGKVAISTQTESANYHPMQNISKLRLQKTLCRSELIVKFSIKIDGNT